MSNQNPIELARLIVNKTIVPERKGRGRRGYGCRPAVRLFVYAQLKGIYKDEQLERHLKKNPGVARAIGLKGVPDRTTIGRWKRRLEPTVRVASSKSNND